MNLIDVNEKFKTEEACWNYLQEMRWPSGDTSVLLPVGRDRFIDPTVKRSLKQKNAADMFRRIFLFSNTALGGWCWATS